MRADIKEVKKERFQDLLGKKELVDIFRRMLTESYVGRTPGHEQEMKNILDETFDLLIKNKDDDEKFATAVKYIISDVFRKKDSSFWFNKVYKNYKRNTKPQNRFQKIKPLLRGKRVLDIGCGDGLLSSLLSKNGFDVYMTDIIDIRDAESEHLPFKKMEGPTKIPYPDKHADTAILFAVLHHVDSENLEKVLDELKRTSQRIIIEEDCYDIPDDLPGFKEVIQQDQQLQEFMKLSKEDQFRYMMLLDYFGNVLAQGISKMNLPFEFKTIEEWHELFAKRGFKVQTTLLLGFQKGNFNRVPHTWFVLDVA